MLISSSDPFCVVVKIPLLPTAGVLAYNFVLLATALGSDACSAIVITELSSNSPVPVVLINNCSSVAVFEIVLPFTETFAYDNVVGVTVKTSVPSKLT